MTIRRTVHFSGRVQGVGFRATTCHVATDFEVTGFVRNLADGRVEMVAEGEPRELTRFCDALKSHMKSHISECSETEGPATGEFKAFRTGY